MAEIAETSSESIEAPNNPADQSYASDHLYLVAFLVCSGNLLIGTTRVGTRISFVFEKTPNLLADVARYMAGAAVPARRFSYELLKLKRILHECENSRMKKMVKHENEESSSCNS